MLKIINTRNGLYKTIHNEEYSDRELRIIEYFYKKHKFFKVEVIL